MFIAVLISLQFFIFIALIIMLKRIMGQNVISATKHLDELSQDYAKKEQQINKRLEEVKQQSQEMLSKAKDEAEAQKAQALKDANSESENILKHARGQSDDIIQQADKARQLLLSEINERIAREAVNKACELIQYTLPEQFKRDVHSQWVDELIDSGFTNLERLHIPQDTKEVRLVSAFSLKDEQRKALSKKLKSALGSEVELKEDVDPKIVAGIVVNIGSLVLDGSLKNKIQEQAKNENYADNG